MMGQTLGMAAGLGLRQGAVIRRQEEATKRGILAAEREKERLRKKQQKYTVQEKGTNMSGMFLLADFGETKRQNKAKKRLWESNRASLNSERSALNTEAFLEGRRKRGILKDPLALRSYEGIAYGSPGAKITAPYRTKAAYIDLKRQKGILKRKNAVNNYKFEKLADDIEDIQTNQRVGNSKTKRVNLLPYGAKPDTIPRKIVQPPTPSVSINAPDLPPTQPISQVANKNIKNAQESSKNVASLNSINKPKLNTGGLLLTGGLGLGAIGTGLYLANRKKKEKQNV